MRRTLLLVIISVMMLTVPASAANFRFSGTFANEYFYSNGDSQDKMELTLNLNFDEAGLLTAYAPLTLTSGISIADGWWAIFTTEPFNLMLNSVNKWTSIEKTFGMLTTGITTNRYSKMWGKITPNLSYIAQALVLSTSTTPIDKYMIEAELTYDLPKVVKVVSDFGWTYNGLGDTGYNMGLATAVTFPVNTKGGNMKLALANFADLDYTVYPGMLFWSTDDLLAFAAYAGLTGIKLGTAVTLDEISYKLGLSQVNGYLLKSTSFYRRGLQEAVFNISGKFGPVKIKLINGVWFPSTFDSPLGGYNANLDISALFNGLTLGLKFDSKLNWRDLAPQVAWGWTAEFRTSFRNKQYTISSHLGYVSNWEGVYQYVIDEEDYAEDRAYADIDYDDYLGFHFEAFGEFDQKGTNHAEAGLYLEYDNTFDEIPIVMDLSSFLACRVGYLWNEGTPASAPDVHDPEAIGMVKLDSTFSEKWKGGLLFISRNNGSADLSFEPIASIYLQYLPSEETSFTGRVTYRMYGVGDVTKVHNLFAQLKGDIKLSNDVTASAYWGKSGFETVPDGNTELNYPWGEYFEVTKPMYWDTFGVSFTVDF